MDKYIGRVDRAGAIACWPKRWNNGAGPHAIVDQAGESFFILTCQGYIYCDKEDLPFIRDQLKAAVILLSGIIDA
jgi:hypothetical protein